MWLGLALIFFGLFAVVNGIISLTDNKTRLIAPDNIITIEVVDTDEARQMGLSGRTRIDDKEGMLFVFDDPSTTNCFHMKDMLFSIDMIWLDEDKQVVTVIEGVAPDSFPEPFCPTEGAKYGLEVSDGNANDLGITEGVKLRF
jgi:uncharacterized membrane protein (UPF0127 family)